jgi:tRNA 2-thiouridine synthesizing protein A
MPVRRRNSSVAPGPQERYFATEFRIKNRRNEDLMADEPHFLDTTGLNCPLPVLKAKKAMKTLKDGERLKVHATDPASTIDFRHYCAVSGYLLETMRETDGLFEYIIVKTPTP